MLTEMLDKINEVLIYKYFQEIIFTVAWKQ
jgi:hypothetical protein